MCQVEPLYSSLFSSFHGVPGLSVFYFILITRFLSACSLNHFNTIVFVNLTLAPAYPVSLVSCWHGLFSCCISVHFTGLIPFISRFIVVWTCALSWWSSSVIYPLATMDWSMVPKSAWLWLCLWIIPCTFCWIGLISRCWPSHDYPFILCPILSWAVWGLGNQP